MNIKLKQALVLSTAVLGLLTAGASVRANASHVKANHSNNGLALTQHTDPLSRASILYQGYLREYPNARYNPVSRATVGRQYDNYLNGRYGIWKYPAGHRQNHELTNARTKTALAANYIPFRVTRQTPGRGYDKVVSQKPHLEGWVNDSGVYRFGSRAQAIKAVKTFSQAYRQQMKQSQRQQRHQPAVHHVHRTSRTHRAARHLKRHAVKRHRTEHRLARTRVNKHRTAHRLARRHTHRTKKPVKQTVHRHTKRTVAHRTRRQHQARRSVNHRHGARRSQRARKAKRSPRRVNTHLVKKTSQNRRQVARQPHLHMISRHTYLSIAQRMARHHTAKKLTVHKATRIAGQQYALIYYGNQRLGWINTRLLQH